MNLFDSTIQTFLRTLGNVDRWLDKAEAHAKERNYDPAVLLTLRLAPDQYALLRQIQSMCDAAKSPAARLAGKEPPVHPDTETTWAEARARITTCAAYVSTITANDLEGALDRTIPLPFIPGMGSPARAYVAELAMPNFFFHITMTYAILRHAGVPLGKVDFIGPMTLVPV